MNYNKFIILLFVLTVIILNGCHTEANKRLAYKGDGKLIYLKAPFLGISGWKLELPHFNLAEGIDIKYNLTGLPCGEEYLVYLSVRGNLPKEISQSTFAFQLMHDNKIVRELQPVQISQMVNTSSHSGENLFWYYDQKNKDPNAVYKYAFSVDKDSSKLAIRIVCSSNIKLQQPVDAYIIIRRGGER